MYCCTARRSDDSPARISLDRHSSLTDLTQRSAYEFKFGLLAGHRSGGAFAWSRISNALKRLGFRSRNFLAQLLSETSRACTIRVRRSSSGRLWNDLGSHACLHHRNRRPGTFTEERISGRREPDPESPNQRQVAVIRCRKATLAEIAHRLGRKALEALSAIQM